ncbi:MAG: hypothetical protein Fur0023_19780 [Bacteroidia bacterium]
MQIISEIKQQNIFISALDWGNGHLVRTAALIQKLKENNHITIFSTQHQSKFYSHLFPELQQVFIQPYNINFYPEHIFKNIFSAKNFFYAIQKEQSFLFKYIQNTDKKPDIIISDNRYGFYHPDFKSILITHQLHLYLPKVFIPFNWLMKKFLKNFDEIWIPDYAEEEMSLAGRLSHPKEQYKNIRYIQPLSLMKKNHQEKIIDYLFIVSGTQAERRYYEEMFYKDALQLLNENKNLNIKITGSIRQDGKVLLGWRNFKEMNDFILSSKNIISRPGYSTLMDWHVIADNTQNIFLIKPKYQYEQRYLFEYWISKKWAKEWNVKQVPADEFAR